MTDAKVNIERELELIDGMIEVQLHHAKQCDGIANRTMAEKQKAWDMDRVALLRKMRAALAAQTAEPQEPVASYWLIECKNGFTGWYAGHRLDCRFFDTDPRKAYKFASKELAENEISERGHSCVIATEHVDIAAPPAPLAPRMADFLTPVHKEIEMLLDLINPSDPYTLEADDFEIAAVAVCLLGAGKYPATALGNDAREDNNVPPFLFGGHDDWFNQRFGASFEATAERVLEGRADALARALESVKLGSNRRTSLNDIGVKAHEMARAVREQYLTPTPPKEVNDGRP